MQKDIEYGEKAHEIRFKWNGCIGAVDVCAKLRFHNLQNEWKFKESCEE